MQREQILEHALNVLEQNGLAATLSLETTAGSELTRDQLQQFWPDRDALLYDALRYHGQQIETGGARFCWMNRCRPTRS